MKRKLLITALAMLSFISMRAEENNAIYAWVNGTSTCYKLESMPHVTYSDGSALLTLAGKTTPELIVPLNGENLQIVYGIYKETKPTNIDNIEVEETKVTKNGKYITGGCLVIVKNGKLYNSNGILIK